MNCLVFHSLPIIDSSNLGHIEDCATYLLLCNDFVQSTSSRVRDLRELESLLLLGRGIRKHRVYSKLLYTTANTGDAFRLDIVMLVGVTRELAKDIESTYAD